MPVTNMIPKQPDRLALWKIRNGISGDAERAGIIRNAAGRAHPPSGGTTVAVLPHECKAALIRP
ncbi:hypothetical protein GCM10023205_52870 [Yinghuangia aomiensis]|uniref:Uncharacterized protein n=1 Tax=Yinghuangia aomiensis TaxID=676205 RepID=A0ABP9HTI3_9ACTN